MERIREVLKNWLERSFAILLPSLPAAPFLLPIEVALLGAYITGTLRILSGVPIIIFNPYWEKIRKPIKKKLEGESGHWFRIWIADGLAISIYEIPIFWLSVFILWICGYEISSWKVILLSFVYFLKNMIFGGASGKLLDWFRLWFNGSAKSPPEKT